MIRQGRGKFVTAKSKCDFIATSKTWLKINNTQNGKHILK